METSHIEQYIPDARELNSDHMRALILAEEARIQALYEMKRGNPGSFGETEAWDLTPAIRDVVGDADRVLAFTPQEVQEFNRLIQDLADGSLAQPDHAEALERFVQYCLRYHQARAEKRH